MTRLVDPFSGENLTQLKNFWVSPCGNKYPIVNDIPRFVEYNDQGQSQTSDSFGYKWNKQAKWGHEGKTKDILWDIYKDFFGWTKENDLKELVEGRTVLDAGCGSGTAISQYIEYAQSVTGVDISNSVDACKGNFQQKENLSLIQADINHMPLPENYFDIGWSCGVLHHTPSTFESLSSLTRHVKNKGLVIVYIYVKKAPIREFTDDYFRDKIAAMSNDEAWESMRRLTKLSKALSELDASITLDEDIPELGFKKGEYDLQRFIYYNIMKCFWNSKIDFEENVHVNFDWYRPTYSHRHTPEEVREWLSRLNLKEISFNVSDSGIGFVAEKM